MDRASHSASRSSRTSQAINVSSFLLLVALAAVVIAVCSLDIFLRIHDDKLTLLAVGSSCAILGRYDYPDAIVFCAERSSPTSSPTSAPQFLGAVLIVSSRKLSIRSAFNDIPKLYIPINPSDLPE
ncbi:hypothetical protein BDK51DRAFT_43345, partial [Blyttiomyces helicus]